MAAASLFLRSSESAPFTGEPLVRVAGALLRVANLEKRLWDGPVTAEHGHGDTWEPLPLERVERLCGEAHGSPVGDIRATGRFFPLSAAGCAEGWRLGYEFDPGAPSLARRRQGRLTGVTVTLNDVEMKRPVAAGDLLYVVLHGDESDYVCLAEMPAADRSPLRLSVDANDICVTGS